MNREEANRKMGQVIAKAWADESFKAKLLASPAETLKAEGVELPAGVKVKAVENTKEVFHLVIPAKPVELSDQDLDRVAGGADQSCFSSACCASSLCANPNPIILPSRF